MPGPIYYPRVKDALSLLEKKLIFTKAVEETPANKESRDWLLYKHTIWENSITGIAMGYYVEAEKALKHLQKKNLAGSISEKVGGKIIKKNRGDITTITNKYNKDGKSQGKVIQLKHTICDTPSAVSEAIKDAFIQLSGKNGELPLEDDILIADIFIANPKNAWPFDRTSQTNGRDWISHDHTFLISQFEAAVKNRLMKYLMVADFKTNYAVAKKEKDFKVRGYKESRSLDDVYGTDEALHGDDVFKSDVDTLSTFPSLKSHKIIKLDRTGIQPITEKHTTDSMIEEDPLLVSKEYPFAEYENFIDFPSLILKINFTTGRKVRFEKKQEDTMVKKIVLSVRWEENGSLSVKFVREKPIS